MTLFIFCGGPFSGKSYLSKQLSVEYGFSRVDLDEVKDELVGKNIIDEEVFRDQWDEVYEEMYRRIEKHLSNDETVVLDAANYARYERDLARKIGDKYGAKVVEILVDTPIEVVRKRWLENKKTKKRIDVSEDVVMKAREKIEFSEGKDSLIVDGNLSLESQMKQIYDKFLK